MMMMMEDYTHFRYISVFSGHSQYINYSGVKSVETITASVIRDPKLDRQLSSWIQQIWNRCMRKMSFTSSDRQRIDNFIRRSVKSNFCSCRPTIFRKFLWKAEKKTTQSGCEQSDTRPTFPSVPAASQNYTHRPRKYDQEELQDKTTHLTECNFMNRMLFADFY